MATRLNGGAPDPSGIESPARLTTMGLARDPLKRTARLAPGYWAAATSTPLAAFAISEATASGRDT